MCKYLEQYLVPIIITSYFIKAITSMHMYLSKRHGTVEIAKDHDTENLNSSCFLVILSKSKSLHNFVFFPCDLNAISSL